MAEEPANRTQQAGGITVTYGGPHWRLASRQCGPRGEPADLNDSRSGRHDIPFFRLMPYELDPLQPGERENQNLQAQFTIRDSARILSGVESNRGF